MKNDTIHLMNKTEQRAIQASQQPNKATQSQQYELQSQMFTRNFNKEDK